MALGSAWGAVLVLADAVPVVELGATSSRQVTLILV